MKYKVLSIPILGGEDQERELNAFFSSRKIITVRQQAVEQEGRWYWTFLVEYLESMKPESKKEREKIDYREILSDSDFQVFARLRELRKRLAEQQGIPWIFHIILLIMSVRKLWLYGFIV